MNNQVRKCARGAACPCTSRRNDDRNCRTVMDQLRAVDFALTETVLYLDAYPECREAMEFYHKLTAQRRELVASYERQCGPLTMYGNGENAWEWAQGPWPWEAEANE